jgi:L-fuconolactonase
MRIDSHQHFWNYHPTEYVWMTEEHHAIRRDILPADLLPLLEAAGIDASIAVQARQLVKETDFLLELAQQHPCIKGVVGWLPLMDPGLPALLEDYANRPGIVGFRHVVHDEPDPDFILRPDFNRGIRMLAKYPLCYDILIFRHHLPQTIRFADMHEDMTLIVDHIAKPDIRKSVFDHQWADGIRELARRPHVHCKLSGMMTEVRDKEWDLDTMRPYFETVLEAFGPDRLMYGSDWPVCLVAGNYAEVMDVVKSYIEKLPAAQQESAWLPSVFLMR